MSHQNRMPGPQTPEEAWAQAQTAMEAAGVNVEELLTRAGKNLAVLRGASPILSDEELEDEV